MQMAKSASQEEKPSPRAIILHLFQETLFVFAACLSFQRKDPHTFIMICGVAWLSLSRSFSRVSAGIWYSVGHLRHFEG